MFFASEPGGDGYFVLGDVNDPGTNDLKILKYNAAGQRFDQLQPSLQQLGQDRCTSELFAFFRGI